MKNKIIACYSIFLGISVMTMWIMILFNKDIPEGKLELSFHLFSEFLMALLCLLSGILLLKNVSFGKSLNILGLGMVIYSVLNATGYYGERKDYSMLIMFLIIFLLTLAAILLHLINIRLANNTTKH